MLMTLGLPGKISRGQFALQRLALLPVITTTFLGLDEKDPRCTASSVPLLILLSALGVGPKVTLRRLYMSWRPF